MNWDGIIYTWCTALILGRFFNGKAEVNFGVSSDVLDRQVGSPHMELTTKFMNSPTHCWYRSLNQAPTN